MTDRTIGLNIKRLREASKLSQQGLADAVNVSLPAVQGWESGRNEVRASTIKKLCRLFQVTSDEILGLHTLSSSNPQNDTR